MPRGSLEERHNTSYRHRMTPRQVKALRNALGLTQKQLADMIGAYQPTVTRWERGANQPKGAYLKALQNIAAKAKKEKAK